MLTFATMRQARMYGICPCSSTIRTALQILRGFGKNDMAVNPFATAHAHFSLSTSACIRTHVAVSNRTPLQLYRPMLIAGARMYSIDSSGTDSSESSATSESSGKTKKSTKKTATKSTKKAATTTKITKKKATAETSTEDEASTKNVAKPTTEVDASTKKTATKKAATKKTTTKKAATKEKTVSIISPEDRKRRAENRLILDRAQTEGFAARRKWFWTLEEEKKLLELAKTGMGTPQIAVHFPDRSRASVGSHLRDIINTRTGVLRRGIRDITQDEIDFFLKLVDEYRSKLPDDGNVPHILWQKIASRMGRRATDLRHYYERYHADYLIRGPMTPEEDAYFDRKLEDFRKAGFIKFPWNATAREMKRSLALIYVRYRFKVLQCQMNMRKK